MLHMLQLTQEMQQARISPEARTYDAAVAERSMSAKGVMDLPPDGPTLQAVGKLVDQLDI